MTSFLLFPGAWPVKIFCAASRLWRLAALAGLKTRHYNDWAKA
jgi:hypothetical protein